MTASDFIKIQTTTAHEKAEQTLVMYAKRIHTVAGYARLLNCLHDYHAPAEVMVQGFGITLRHRKVKFKLVEALGERYFSHNAAGDNFTLKKEGPAA
jgi:hypothetical protein